MGVLEAWLAALLLKIKIYLIVYLIALAGVMIYAVVIYFTIDAVHIGVETFTTNGVYLLESSFFQRLENTIFGNIEMVLSNARKAIVFSDVFRTTAVLVAILATVLMGFTMLIGDQKITIKEFFWDVLLIFGSIALLLYYDPTLSTDPNVPAQPEKYITLLYNFLNSISQFVSTQLFSAVDGAMNVQYKDGTPVGYYAPIDVLSSLFTDSNVSYRFKVKLAGLILSPALPFVPIVLIVTFYQLIPCILTTFIAILFAKTTIMFAVQFLPFFILFSSINDVKIKMNKKDKGMNFLTKVIFEGVAQPMVFLALTSFLAGFLLNTLVVSNISDVFAFSIVPTSGVSFEYEQCAYVTVFGIEIPYDVFCVATNLFKSGVSFALNLVLPEYVTTQGLNVLTFFTGVVKLWVGIAMFKYLFGKITPIIQNIVSKGVDTGSGVGAAADIFSQGGGLYSQDNEMTKLSNTIYKDNLDVAQDMIKTQVEDKKEKKPDPQPTPSPK